MTKFKLLVNLNSHTVLSHRLVLPTLLPLLVVIRKIKAINTLSPLDDRPARALGHNQSAPPCVHTQVYALVHTSLSFSAAHAICLRLSGDFLPQKSFVWLRVQEMLWHMSSLSAAFEGGGPRSPPCRTGPESPGRQPCTCPTPRRWRSPSALPSGVHHWLWVLCCVPLACNYTELNQKGATMGVRQAGQSGRSTTSSSGPLGLDVKSSLVCGLVLLLVT